MANKTDNAYKYEVFINRAYQSRKEDSTLMKGIMYFEMGLRSKVKEKDYQKELQTVKGKLEKAFDKFLTKKLEESERIQLTILKKEIPGCLSSDSLIMVLDRALDATQRFKEFM